MCRRFKEVKKDLVDGARVTFSDLVTLSKDGSQNGGRLGKNFIVGLTKKILCLG